MKKKITAPRKLHMTLALWLSRSKVIEDSKPDFRIYPDPNVQQVG